MKKTLALNVLTNFQEIAKENLDIIKLVKDENSLFTFKDIDPESSFYFMVVEKLDGGNYTIVFAPYDYQGVDPVTINQNAEAIAKQFSSWVKLVRTYSEMETVFDDPVLKKHEDYFFNEFGMADSDAEYAPFEIPKQFLLAEYLENIKVFIAENQEDFRDEKEPGILIQECHDIIEELPTLPKNVVIKKIATVCAKIAKNGMTILKKFISTSAPEFGKKIAQLSAENLINLIKNHTDDITSLLN